MGKEGVPVVEEVVGCDLWDVNQRYIGAGVDVVRVEAAVVRMKRRQIWLQLQEIDDQQCSPAVAWVCGETERWMLCWKSK